MDRGYFWLRKVSKYDLKHRHELWWEKCLGDIDSVPLSFCVLPLTMARRERVFQSTNPTTQLLLFSGSVMSNSLRPHGQWHARLPCPSISPGVFANSCLLSWWCHPTISSSVVPFSSCLQSFPGVFQWVSSSHQVAKVLELQLQHQSFQWIFRVDFL